MGKKRKRTAESDQKGDGGGESGRSKMRLNSTPVERFPVPVSLEVNDEQEQIQAPPVPNELKGTNGNGDAAASITASQIYQSPEATRTSKSSLRRKFNKLCLALRDILSETVMDKDWIDALGDENDRLDLGGKEEEEDGGEKKRVRSEDQYAFVQALRQLHATGHLAWMSNMVIEEEKEEEEREKEKEGGEEAVETKKERRDSSFTSLAVPVPTTSSISISQNTSNSSLQTTSGSTTTSWPPSLPPITDPTIRSQVFTHRSYTGIIQPIPSNSSSLPSNPSTPLHYERLEFLGDSVLQYISSHLIYHLFPPTISEGQLSAIRQKFVSNKTLHIYSLTYNLPTLVRTGPDFLKSNAITNVKFGADVFEAYLGALIAQDPTDDGGLRTVTKFLEELFRPKLQEELDRLCPPPPPSNPTTSSSTTTITSTTPLNKSAKHVLWNTVGAHPSAKINYNWTGGGGGNKGGYWYTAVLTGYGYVDLELGKGWGANKSEGMMRAAMEALENKGLLREVGKVRGDFLDRVKREKEKEEKEKKEKEKEIKRDAKEEQEGKEGEKSQRGLTVYD